MGLRIVVVQCVLLASLFVSRTVAAQDSKMDSVLSMQKEILHAVKGNPLADKTFGVEINPFYLLFMDQYFQASAGFSLFNINRQAEISIPFVISKDLEDTFDYMQIVVDAHYRYFMGDVQNGFYVSGTLRNKFETGTAWDTWYGENSRTVSDDRIGLGFGFGYRKFSTRGLYWGTSLTIGRYFTGGDQIFVGDLFSIFENDFFMDIEMFKFGWAF